MEDNIYFEEITKSDRSIAPGNTSQYPSYIPGMYYSVFVELYDKCDPEKYMNPYDYEKVKIANKLHRKVKEHRDNEAELIKIREEAVNQLGITLSTERLFKELSETLNPRNFCDDSDNLALANEYYHQVLSNADNLKFLEELSKDSQVMKLQEIAKEVIKQRNKRGDENTKVAVGIASKIRMEEERLKYISYAIVLALVIFSIISLFVS